jgi:hypothetical protein
VTGGVWSDDHMSPGQVDDDAERRMRELRSLMGWSVGLGIGVTWGFIAVATSHRSSLMGARKAGAEMR